VSNLIMPLPRLCCLRGLLGGLVPTDQPRVVVAVDKPLTAWRSWSMVSWSSAHRHCSLRVRIQRSAQPLVSGSPRKAALSAMPSQAIEPQKWPERYWVPSRGAAADRGRCLGRAGPSGRSRRHRGSRSPWSAARPYARPAPTPDHRWIGPAARPPSSARRPPGPGSVVAGLLVLVLVVHRHDRHLHPCLLGVQENRERWTPCFRRSRQLCCFGLTSASLADSEAGRCMLG
jgi:hypothetical protein